MSAYFQQLLLACTSLVLFSNAEVGNILYDNATAGDITGDYLVVHIVTHTHDDPGWLITTDEYYVQEVQWIFYTMIPILKDNPARKFTYVEMAYMSRWWQEIDDSLKQDTLDMIDNGQLQINLGGWCMNDEANPTATAVIHQMTDGNQFVLHNFGDNGRPTVAWHVDPFGHSPVTGGMWAQAGFDAFAVHRINQYDLEKRRAEKNLEFMWKGSSSLGEDGWIFFHILENGYCSPAVINFWNGQSWIQNDPLLPSWPPNQIPLAENFMAEVRKRATYYRHNNILIPFGCDFAHTNAYQSMVQMDKFIEYINGNKTYNAYLKYSTLADYIQDVNKLDLTWPLEDPDFFTYVSAPHQWWSGYFTSRPLMKLYVRTRQNLQRTSELFYLYAKNLRFPGQFESALTNITKLRNAIAVSLHHDAITGTEKDFVAAEYMGQMRNATIDVDYFLRSTVGQFFKKYTSSVAPQLDTEIGDLLTALTGNNYVVMPVYNSLPWSVTEFIRIPTNRTDLAVYDAAGKALQFQIIPLMVGAQPYDYPAKYQIFVYTTLAPLSFQTYFIGIDVSSSHLTRRRRGHARSGDVIGNGYYSIQVDKATNLVTGIRNNKLGKMFRINNNFVQYTPSGGAYSDGETNSGAYIFRPAQDSRYVLAKSDSNNKKTSLVIRQPFTSANPQPGFLVTTYGSGSYLDVFQGKVCLVDLNKNVFDFQYYRVDGGSGWGQRPMFDWLSFDQSDKQYNNHLDIWNNTLTGIKLIVKSTTNIKMITISFGSTFGTNVPDLLVSVRGNLCDGSQYSTMITSVTATGATVYIKRIDNNAAWNEDVNLDWVAYDPKKYVSDQRHLQGSTVVNIANNKVIKNVSIKLGSADFWVYEPVVIVSVQQVSPVANSQSNVYFQSFTTYSNNNLTFQLRLYPNNPSGSGNVQLKVNFWAFERYALKDDVSQHVSYVVEEGKLVSEVQQFFKDNYAQSWRLYHVNDSDLQYVENQIHIGPIDQAAEFVTKFETEFDNKKTWYTNQASLEYVKRVNFPYWDEPIAANYYPSSSQTYIDDDAMGVRFATIVNQGHGIGCLENGEIEIMLQRRCLADDHKGVNEVLNTTSHTEPQILLLIDDPQNVAYLSRRLYYIQQFPYTQFWGTTDSIANYVKQFNTSWTAMNAKYLPGGLPANIFLMQLRYAYSGADGSDKYSRGTILQLQNMFEVGESKLYSNNVTINLNEIIDPAVFSVKTATEMTLTANLPLKDLNRLPWNVQLPDGRVKRIRDPAQEEMRRKRQEEVDGKWGVNLFPRDIRTFVVNYAVDKENRQRKLG